jgi:7-carboxy-7-deazaguanine synthase
VAVEALVRECLDAHTAVAEITGGEPLLQPGFGTLAESLRDRTGRPVLVETNGSQDLSLVPDGVVAVMDIKCPGSGETAAMAWDNLGRLRRCDEVKFVLTDRADFDWACDLVERERLEARCAAVLFSAAAGCLDPALLAGWIIERRPPVRLQVQWHRVLGIP